MTLKPEAEVDTNSPSLISYLKEEIPIDDMRDAHSAERIESIDYVKGLAMVFIILCHTAAAWLDDDWVYIYGMVYAALDILGPSLFIFLSALSVIFSIKRKKGKLPEKVIKSRIYSRGFVIMGIGLLYNFLAFGTLIDTGYTFPFTIWGWNILMFIGFSQIVSYHSLKLKKNWRVIIGVVIIVISPILREVIYLGKDDNIGLWILHYIITSPAPQVTLFPWIAVCFLSTIFGEMLYDAMIEGPGLPYERLVRLFYLWGVIFVLIGFLCPFPYSIYMPYFESGFNLQTFSTLPVSEYQQLELWHTMNLQNYYKFPGMPLFMIRGTPSAMFYQLGAALLLIGLSFSLIDIKKKKIMLTDVLIYYGKVSLSLFLLHYTFVPIYLRAFNMVFFPFVVLTYIGFFGFLMFLWFEFFGGKGSPEYIMIQMGRVGQKASEEIVKGSKNIAEGSKKIAKKTKKTIAKTFKKDQEEE